MQARVRREVDLEERTFRLAHGGKKIIGRQRQAHFARTEVVGDKLALLTDPTNVCPITQRVASDSRKKDAGNPNLAPGVDFYALASLKCVLSQLNEFWTNAYGQRTR